MVMRAQRGGSVDEENLNDRPCWSLQIIIHFKGQLFRAGPFCFEQYVLIHVREVIEDMIVGC